VAILKRHLLEKVPISDLCDELHLSPSLYHQWQKQFFDQGTAAFERKNGNRRADDAKDRQIAQLQEKIAQKNEVVAELLQEHVQLKKELGEL
jgi:transposase